MAPAEVRNKASNHQKSFRLRIVVQKTRASQLKHYDFFRICWRDLAIESQSKSLGVLPMVKFYMDQIKLFPLLDKYLPKPKTMDLAPAQVLSMMVMNIITSVRPMYKVSDWVADYLDDIGEVPSNALKWLLAILYG